MTVSGIAIWMYLVGLAIAFHFYRVLEIERDWVAVAMAFIWPISAPIVLIYGYFKYGYEESK